MDRERLHLAKQALQTDELRHSLDLAQRWGTRLVATCLWAWFIVLATGVVAFTWQHDGPPLGRITAAITAFAVGLIGACALVATTDGLKDLAPPWVGRVVEMARRFRNASQDGELSG